MLDLPMKHIQDPATSTITIQASLISHQACCGICSTGLCSQLPLLPPQHSLYSAARVIVSKTESDCVTPLPKLPANKHHWKTEQTPAPFNDPQTSGVCSSTFSSSLPAFPSFTPLQQHLPLVCAFITLGTSHTPGPLHLPFPFPGILFLQVCSQLSTSWRSFSWPTCSKGDTFFFA